MKVGIDLIGDDRLREAFRRLDTTVRDGAIRELAQGIFNRVQDAADRHTKTGALARSVDLERQGDSWMIGNRLQMAPYAVFLHWGSRPHLIHPNKRKALRWAKGGRFHFAKVVRHPGYRGDPWYVREAALAPREFHAILTRRIGEIGNG